MSALDDLIASDLGQGKSGQSALDSVIARDGGASAVSAPSTPQKSPLQNALSDGGDLVEGMVRATGNKFAGLIRGAGSIGATLLTPYDLAVGNTKSIGNPERRQAMDDGLSQLGADTSSLMYGAGKLGGEIMGTAGVGPALATGLKVAVPGAVPLINAVRTAGFTTGMPSAAADAGFLARAASLAKNMAVRTAGGAVTGGTTAGLIDPQSAPLGVAVGGAMPAGVSAVGNGASYVGQGIKSFIDPFTQSGVDSIANRVLKKFAQGGPTALNTASLIPGSTPTLAESSGNAGLATLQRAMRDVRPNAFVEREQANAAARSGAFDDVAGDAGKLDYFKASRDQAANDLYGRALDPANQQPMTPYLKGQVTQLLKRPSIDDASRTAQQMALERGEKPSAMGSLAALHDVKTALDDQISTAVRAGLGGQAQALQATKAKLMDVLEKLSPDYAEARTTYAQMSQPINEMEALQGLKLTDQTGKITLSKVQNALRSLQDQRALPGVNPAKSIQDSSMATLQAIRDDLLRQNNVTLGKSIGSNTFQNLATDNIVGTLGAGLLGGIGNQTGIGGVLGQVGKYLYSGPNEAIKEAVLMKTLNPALAAPAFVPQGLLNQSSWNPLIRQQIHRASGVIAADQ